MPTSRAWVAANCAQGAVTIAKQSTKDFYNLELLPVERNLFWDRIWICQCAKNRRTGLQLQIFF